jgi:hypothetical protein
MRRYPTVVAILYERCAWYEVDRQTNDKFDALPMLYACMKASPRAWINAVGRIRHVRRERTVAATGFTSVHEAEGFSCRNDTIYPR